MATKRVCDRCGAEINPYNSVTYAGMRRIKGDINDNDYELCASCAHKLRKWFNGEEVVRGVWDIMEGTKTRRICSKCGWDVPEYGKFYSYCPNCGAKMDGGEDRA